MNMCDVSRVMRLLFLLSIFFISCVDADKWRVETHPKPRRRLAKKAEKMKRRKLQDGDSQPCSPCICYSRWGKQYLDCSLVDDLDALPDDIPINTTRMWLSGQALTDIGNDNIIPQLNQLEELLLNGNGDLVTINENAFANVPNLRMLLLHYTAIEEIQDNLFAGLTNLRELWINDCNISSIGPNAFNHNLNRY